MRAKKVSLKDLILFSFKKIKFFYRILVHKNTNSINWLPKVGWIFFL